MARSTLFLILLALPSAVGQGCADNSDDVVLVVDRVVACAGSFPPGMGVAGGGVLCAAGWAMCPDDDTLTAEGVTSAMCMDACAAGGPSFYATEEASDGGWDCNNDNPGNTGSNDVWGCGCSGPNAGIPYCGPMGFALGNSNWGGWTGYAEHTVERDTMYHTGGSGGVLCCKQQPTCDDGVQNQGETDIDCGGPCAACGSCVGDYTLVFRQTFPNLFSASFVGTLNDHDDSSANYAILDRLADFQMSDGRFQFKLFYPENGNTQEWYQTSNPWTDTTVTGYAPKAIFSTANYWGGLERNYDPPHYSLIDGSVNHVFWFYSIGSLVAWGVGIPAADFAVNVVELYVWEECAVGGADPNVCTQADKDSCRANSVCAKADDVVSCACKPGFEEVNGECVDVDECQTSQDAGCHHLAYCDNLPGAFQCVCPAGFLGNGYECSSTSWSVRTVFQCTSVAGLDVDALQLAYAEVVRDVALNATDDMVETAKVEVFPVSLQVTINALFSTQAAADERLQMLNELSSIDWSGIAGAGCAAAAAVDGPDVYSFVGRSTSDPLPVEPSGFEVQSVVFDASCLQSGCWVVDVVYSTGTQDFNAFFLPKAVGNETQSFDFDYSTIDSDNGGRWPQSPADTFFPATHPCTSADYDAGDGLLAQVSACCLDQFLDMYRPMATFTSALAGSFGTNCGVGARDRPLEAADVRTLAVGELPGDGVAPDGVYLTGLFDGLASSYGEAMGVIDPYVGVYKARFHLDELELRRSAGQLRGTVGVEHSTDTFLGLINLSPTATYVLDTFATQVAIHLEKTSFFSVSTHGTNDYTFLEYVNLRLVAIYAEDSDFSGTAESSAETVRTRATDAAHYIQVTFTLGSKYGVNANSGLIPLDSVRAGEGSFFDSAAVAHKCLEWTNTGASFARQGVFASRLNQTCAPAAAMCASPTAIPDSFVSFNVPLGVDFFNEPSDTLSENVFVDMVISAVDNEASGTPNAGDDPKQMKTTLSASIPIVEGGVNIFCDGFTAKTDLKDVANADIVVGSASSSDELTRLRIKEDVASTQLSGSAITQIDSDSIEAGLMTLVLKGDASYFESNSGRLNVKLELEDVITIHIMESDTGAGADADVASSVMALVTSAPADNSDASGLDTDGYALNGAFYFTIDRSAQRAHLEPSDELLAHCPFNPPRAADSVSLETCVTRRDVRYRQFPWRAGGKSTAMEICTGTDGSCPCAGCTTSTESGFFATILGDNAYARQLAVDYAAVLGSAYSLNGRYKRAYWINPGYEWTPTQTGGTSIFSVSQKLFLFALVTLDEGLATGDDGASLPNGPGPEVRRRMLLQSTPDQALQDGQASLNADVFEFQTTPRTMMAKAFDVPDDRVATFKVTMALTETQACLAVTELQAAVRSTLDEYLAEAASALLTVQVTSVSVDRAGVQCGRRAGRGLLSGASLEATMMVVFDKGTAATISLAKLETMPGIHAVEPLQVSTKVDTSAPAAYLPPPSDESSSSSVPLIAGAAAGGGVLMLAILGAVVYLRRSSSPQPVTAVETINVHDLKNQLAQEV